MVTIMADMFQTDIREMMAYAKWLKSDPRGVRVASGMMLNNMAFGAREAIHEVLESEFTMRKPGFIKSKILVEKSRFTDPISIQKSAVGSIEFATGTKSMGGEGFSGLVEQQRGDKTKRKRVATTAGRAGSRRKKITSASRMKRPFLDVSKLPVRGSGNARVAAGLSMLDASGHKKPFIIRRHSSIPSGLYRFSGEKDSEGRKKIKMLQAFDPDNLQPRRFKWLTIGVKKYFARTNLDREWIRTARRLLSKRFK